MSQKFPSQRVRTCPSGHVHLEFGWTTVHLEMDQFEDLLLAGAQALREYEAKTSLQDLQSAGGLSHKAH